MKRVISADLIKYNANSAGHRTSDCVKRAISVAFNKDYNEVSKDLIAEMKRQRRTAWNVSPVYANVIKNYGGSYKIPVEGKPTLEEFVDDQLNPNGAYIVTVGRPNRTNSNHVVAVVDGKIYDTWDSRGQVVHNYYVCEEETVGRSASDIDIRDYSDLIVERIYEELDNNAKKYPWLVDQYVSGMQLQAQGDYAAKVSFGIHLEECEYAGGRVYTINFAIALKLDSDDKAARKIIYNTVKTRIYDRLYAINVTEKKKKELYEEKKSAGVGGPSYIERYRTTGLERRFYNQMPSWAQARLSYLNVDRPNQYSDSYAVRLVPLSWDTAAKDTRLFEAYTSSQMLDMLDRYYKNHEIPFEDYDPFEDY